MTTNLFVKLVWIVTTNWVPVHSTVVTVPAVYYPQPPFTFQSQAPTSGHEQATLTSNLVMKVLWKKEPKEFTLESIPFCVTNRTWTEKTEKVYEPGSAEKIAPNTSHITLPSGNILISTYYDVLLPGFSGDRDQRTQPGASPFKTNTTGDNTK